MSHIDEINKALTAHGMWKTRLRDAIDNGKSDFTAEKVSADNQCDFGNWLYSMTPEDTHTEHWKHVQELHKNFHAEAGRVLDLAVKGHKNEAENSVSLGSKFAKVSSDLTQAMIKWKDA